MVRTKHEIWKRFGDPFHLPASLGDDDSTTKSKYCKCNLCNELVIAASARLKDHWDRCKKHPRAIGQLDAGFQPSRSKVARRGFDQGKVPARSSTTTTTSSAVLQTGFLGANSASNDTDNNSSLFSGGREHFDFLKAGEAERLDMLFARAIH